MTRYLSLAEFWLLSEHVTGIDAATLIKASRVDLADSALHAPPAGFDDTDFYPDVYDKAAALACRIAWKHPLPDGNKRAAWACLVFVHRSQRRSVERLGPGSRSWVNRSPVSFVSDDVKVRSGSETELDFGVVFGEQYPKLVAIGVALTGSAEVANDLAQETMARAHRNWSLVSAADAPNAWLRRVMKNLIIDHFRRRDAEVRAIARVADRRLSDDARSVDASLVPTMSELLSVLPERQRMVVALRYVDDLSVIEIASVLEVAVGTVKATLWKARRRLETHLRTETAHG